MNLYAISICRQNEKKAKQWQKKKQWEHIRGKIRKKRVRFIGKRWGGSEKICNIKANAYKTHHETMNLQTEQLCLSLTESAFRFALFLFSVEIGRQLEGGKSSRSRSHFDHESIFMAALFQMQLPSSAHSIRLFVHKFTLVCHSTVRLFIQILFCCNVFYFTHRNVRVHCYDCCMKILLNPKNIAFIIRAFNGCCFLLYAREFWIL